MGEKSAYGKFMERLRSGDVSVDAATAQELGDEYPFFTLPAVLALKSTGLDVDTRRNLLGRVALNAPDGDTLMYLVDRDGEKFANFYPVEKPDATPTTDVAIDTFLDTYGKIDEHEQKLLERLIFNPVPDYSQVLVKESEGTVREATSGQDAMLDAFLASQEQASAEVGGEELAEVQPSVRHEAVKAQADAPLSESLARIYIKQQRFDKAYEIIHQLSLNYPKKSIYFADQLRFLRKLMLIQKAR